jgi:hypothetical protein
MDIETGTVSGAAAADEGSYVRRAQSLLAGRAELFAIAPSRVTRAPGPPQRQPGRASGRQLALPLPRMRGGRRATMVR